MIQTLAKTLFVLLLAVGALGCDPYYRHHRYYRDSYGPGYYGGSRSYSGPYDNSYGRSWGEHRHHHDDD